MAGHVFVSGGSGYIAGFLIRQLIAEGWQVNTTIRNLAREADVRAWLNVDNSKLTFFAADLMSDEGWAEAMAGCTHVAHVASPIPANAPKHEDELIVPAREGALRALLDGLVPINQLSALGLDLQLDPQTLTLVIRLAAGTQRGHVFAGINP